MTRYMPLVLLIVLVAAAGCGESVPKIEITEVIDDPGGKLTIKYLASEFSSNDIDITAHYSIGSVSLADATSGGGDGTAGLATSGSGTVHSFVWNYKTDLGVGRHRGATFVIVPYGPDGRGKTGVIGPIDMGLPKLYTANSGADSVSLVDIGGGIVSSTISVGDNPGGIAALPDETLLFVSNKNDGTVSYVLIADPVIINSVTVGTSPGAVVVSPDGTRVYVVNEGDGTVSVIDTTALPTVVDTFTVGTSPVGLSLTESGDTMFVTNSGDNTVSVLLASDGSPLISPVTTGTTPQGISTGVNHTVVCNYESGTVSIIDNGAIVPVPPQVAVDSQPVAVVVDQFDTFAYVANYGSETISVVNLDSNVVVDTITLGGGMGGTNSPRAMVLDSKGEYLYVVYDTVSKMARIEIASLSIMNTITVGTAPVGVAVLSSE